MVITVSTLKYLLNEILVCTKWFEYEVFSQKHRQNALAFVFILPFTKHLLKRFTAKKSSYAEDIGFKCNQHDIMCFLFLPFWCW